MSHRGTPFQCRSTEALKLLASVHGATTPLLVSALDKVRRDGKQPSRMRTHLHDAHATTDKLIAHIVTTPR